MSRKGEAQTVRVTWSLRERARDAAQLAAPEGSGTSVSRYVSDVIEQRQEAWSWALDYLEGKGWAHSEIRKVLAELPVPVLSSRPGSTVRRAADRADVGSGVGDIATLEAVAMLLLAMEAAAGNQELQAALR